MELAYLGLFSKIFNWVLDRIFEPIFKWLSGLLNTVFTWIFEEILAPILLPIMEKSMNFMIDLTMRIFGNIIYSIFAGILKLIDYMETAFDIFIGIRDVKYYPNTANTSQYIEGSLIEVLLQQETISTIFWLLTAAGLAIALMLTIFATAKSSFDLDFENKRPVSKVLTAMMKTFIQFFIVPFFVYFMLMLSAEILKIASTAITGDTRTTLGRIVFVVASLNAATKTNYNASSNPSFVLGTSPQDKARYPFYIVDAQNGVQPKDYSNIDAVAEWFDVTKFDYLVGFMASIFLLFVIGVCLIIFVQRIFEIVLLYIVSPYFVSTMPLDDGERFGRWRDMFIGKCFTGFGSAIAMRLYMLVCQMIMGNNIRFSNATLGNSIEMDYIMKLFFLIGGAWAVFKSGPMITSILNSGAGQQETMSQTVVGGALYGHTIGKAMHAGSGALMSAFRGKSGEKELSADKAAKNRDAAQKFEGSKNDQKANTAAENPTNTWKKGVAPGRSNIKIGAHRAKTAASSGTTAQTAANSGAAAQTTAGSGTAAQSTGSTGATTPAGRPRRNAMSRDPQMMAAAKAATEAAAAKKSSSATGTAANTKKNFRIGSMIQSTYDDKGNHKIRVLGFGVNRDADGNTMGFKMPIMNLATARTAPGESMKLARIHVPGVVKVNSTLKDGKLNYSDVSILHGLGKYHSDESGSNVRILGGLGQYSQDKEGTHAGVAGIYRHHYEDGGSGVGIGKHITFKKSGDNLKSVKIGALEYSRTGVTKNSETSPKQPESGTPAGGK